MSTVTIFDFFLYSVFTLFYISLAVFSSFTFRNSESSITDTILCLMTACSDFHMHFINGYCFIASFSFVVGFVGLATWGSVGSDIVPVGLLSKWSLRPAALTTKRK